MERIDTATPDLTQENIDKIAELFPDVVTEAIGDDGELRRAIDFDALRSDLADEVVDGPRERYQFTWPGKAAAKLEARTPCDKAFRPCIEESKDWDTTQNLYIEGDNLDALKLLRETYAGKVKLIYIDPPYNTGHDFIYDDDFSQSREDYEGASDEYDEEGGRLVANPESNGRFHSDWCSMMYPRLLLARDLLTDDGAMFISIDEGELKNLEALCDEVFGHDRFESLITWQRKYSVSNNYVGIASMCDYLLVCSKSPCFTANLLPRTDESVDRYSNPDNDPRGPWKAVDYLNQATVSQRPNLCYDIINPNTGKIISNREKAWKYEQAATERFQQDNRIWWGIDGNNSVPALKRFLSEVRDGLTPHNWWPYEDVGHTQEATKEVEDLFGAKVFDFPKPVRLLERVLQIGTGRDSVVLDFFSGSATTAHATMKLNAKDGGSRKFIMVQLPEVCNEHSEAFRTGYGTICELGKERIRRAGEKLAAEIESDNAKVDDQLDLEGVEEKKTIPDIGFRVLKIDSSNFNDTYQGPNQLSQDVLAMYVDNLKEGRTPEDLLFQVLPKFRIPLSAKIKELDICGKRVFDVNDGQMLACFDVGVGIDTIESIAKRKPVYAVFRDASMANDSTEANFEELFKTFSPDTIRRVI